MRRPDPPREPARPASDAPDATDRFRRRLGRALSGTLYSHRPRLAMMPGPVAGPFVESILIVASLLDQLGIEWIAHYGTLLGATRLGGVAPWDEDADLFVRGWRLSDLSDVLRERLEPLGLEVLPKWNAALCIRWRPWPAAQGHIGVSSVHQLYDDARDPAFQSWNANLLRAEYGERRRLPFHGGWVWAPSDVEGPLWRMYGSSGSPEVMSRFTAPSLAPEVDAFWYRARPFHGSTRWDDVEARFRERVGLGRRLGRTLTCPWWWANGAYNVAVRYTRGLGHRLSG